MRIAAVHQFTGKKSVAINPNGRLSKSATHTLCPEQAVEITKCELSTLKSTRLRGFSLRSSHCWARPIATTLQCRNCEQP